MTDKRYQAKRNNREAKRAKRRRGMNIQRRIIGSLAHTAKTYQREAREGKRPVDMAERAVERHSKHLTVCGWVSP